MPSPRRPGDVPLEGSTADSDDTATLAFIGRVRSAHATTQDAPKNSTQARAQGASAWLEIDAPYRPGLQGLAAYSHLIVLGWLHKARRDLIQITRPADCARHPPVVEGGQPKAQPKGVFALRSPVRPNPISLSVARIVSVDIATGQIEIDAIDLLDGTPIVDLKPYRPGIDAVPDAVVP